MKIVIIGTGYVGLVTGVCFAEIGNEVVCVDNNASKVQKLQEGIPTIYERGLEEILKKNVLEKRISFTENLGEVIDTADLIFIAVGTPSKGESGETDLSYVLGVTEDIARTANRDVYVVIKSTAPVGTADKMKERFYIVAKNLGKENINIFVSSNPEFLKEGTAIDDFMHPDRIVIGADDDESKYRLSELYKVFDVPVIFTNIASAQLIKYASNAFNACKISFINSLTRYCDVVGANISDIATGMGLDKRIGRAFLNAGIGYGGSCFPKDVASLKYEISKNTKNDTTGILSGIEDINFKAGYWPVELVESLITQNKVPIKPNIAILGLAFKPNTDDVRYSPAISIITELSSICNIKTYDPIATKNAETALHKIKAEKTSDTLFDEEITPNFNNITYCDCLNDAVDDADIVILCTEWDEFKDIHPDDILSHMRSDIFIDGRNALDQKEMSKIFDYYCVGKPHIYKN